MKSRITYRSSALRRGLLGVAIATAGFGVSACGGNDAVQQQDAGVPTPDAATPDVPGTVNGQLRVLGAGPGNGAIDIYIKGQSTATTSVAYGATGTLATLPAGDYQFEVRPTGTPSTTSALYTSAAITVPANGVATLVASGVLGGGTGTDFHLIGLVDVTTAVPAGKTRVRFVNTIYSSVSLDVDVGDDGTVEIPALARFAAIDAPGMDLPAGADLSIGLQDAAHAKIASFVVPAAMLGDGKQLYLVATGLSNVRSRDPRGMTLLLLGPPDAGSPQAVRPDPVLYFLETSPDAGSVDGYRGADKLFDGVAFGKVAAKSVHASAVGYTLDIRPAGAAASASLGSFETGPVALGQQYLVMLTGLVTPTTPGVDALALRVYADKMQLAIDQGRMRVVHAGVGVAMIDAGHFGTNPVAFLPDTDFASLLPGGASPEAGTTIVSPVNVPLPINPGVRPTADPTMVRRFADANPLSAVDRVFGVFAGAWSPIGTQVPAKFILVKTAPVAWTTTILSLHP